MSAAALSPIIRRLRPALVVDPRESSIIMVVSAWYGGDYVQAAKLLKTLQRAGALECFEHNGARCFKAVGVVSPPGSSSPDPPSSVNVEHPVPPQQVDPREQKSDIHGVSFRTDNRKDPWQSCVKPHKNAYFDNKDDAEEDVKTKRRPFFVAQFNKKGHTFRNLVRRVAGSGGWTGRIKTPNQYRTKGQVRFDPKSAARAVNKLSAEHNHTLPNPEWLFQLFDELSAAGGTSS